MRDIRVLICEFSSIHHPHLKRGFTEAFASAGYAADIRVSDDITEAVEALESHDYEVLVTDLSFNEHISVGLAFIQKIKSSYPDLFVIACSSSAPTYDDTRAMKPTFDMFLPKRVVLTPGDGEINQLGTELQEKMPRLTGFSIEVEGGSVENLRVSGETIPERDFRSLVGQILTDLTSTAEQFQPRVVKLKKVTGGYSGSLVMVAELVGADPNLHYVKTIIKFSRVDWANDEISNFKRYAKWMLPFNKRVELVGEGKTKKFGAVAYAFVFGGETEITNLTEIIEKKDAPELRKFLEIIFDDKLINFYKSTLLRSKIGAGQHYRSRYFPDSRYKETEEKFVSTINSNFRARRVGNNYEIEGEIYPDPFRVVFSGLEKTFSLSVCHGDFNSNNIICADGDRVAYIDFQDTGPGHVLQDFAALEHSIRLNWGRANSSPSNNSDTKTLQVERVIQTMKTAKRKTVDYDNLCIELREIANKRFPQLEEWEYPFAIGALSLKLMRIPGLNETQLCRLAACALVSTQRLSQLTV